ncbi:erythromycin esterase family protein [Dactylosporangium sp. NPDC000521]|uniref:erythromycin esterase family protein n=1 Tax=Dactylosporangium sp. NPDC000521 TaxID=3363975 RepID=UPI0036B69575
MTYPVTAASVDHLLPAPPRILALGEPTHGEDVLLEVRNDLFRDLATTTPFRTIALETDCLKALAVDDYVTTGTGTLDDAMTHGFSHGWGAATPNRDLVRWMRAHNADLPPSQHLHFAGIDGPLELTTGPAAPHQAVTALHSALASSVPAALLPPADHLDEVLGPEDRWTDPAAMLDPSRSIGQTPDAARLRLLCDDLVALLDAHAPAFPSRTCLDRARLYARTATGLLRYHHWMADRTPARMPRLVGLRAAMMAANLLALTDRGPVLVHAHNLHLQRHQPAMRLGDQHLTWSSTGAIAATHLGSGYAFLTTALGTIHHHGVHTPPTDTIEGHLYSMPSDRCLADPRALAATFGDTTPAARVSPWFGYFPLDPAHLTGESAPDGIVFIKDSPPAAGPGE